MYNVFWTDLAEKSYQNLTKRTDKFEKNLDEVLETLESHPRAYEYYQKDKEIRRSVIDKHHSLFYTEANSKNVHLLLFFDTRMNPVRLDKLLK